MKKKSDNSKYFLIGIVALIIIVILLDMRYTGYQTAPYYPPPSDYPGVILPDPVACRAGCAKLNENDLTLNLNCDRFCEPSVCGDGRTTGTEQCDDGPRNSEDGECDSLCRRPCGNYITQISRGEQCDDGNQNDNDGCDSRCRYGVMTQCGRGIDTEPTEYGPGTDFVCGEPYTPIGNLLPFFEGCKRPGVIPFGMNLPEIEDLINLFYNLEVSSECAGEDNQCLCLRETTMDTCSLGDGEYDSCNTERYDRAVCLYETTTYGTDEYGSSATNTPNVPNSDEYDRRDSGGDYCKIMAFQQGQSSRNLNCYCHKKPPMCGGQAYDPSTQRCCGDELPGQGEIYDPSTQECCDRGNQGQIDPLNPNTPSWPPRVCRSRPDEFCISASQNTITNVPECGECPDLQPNFNSAECRRYGGQSFCLRFRCLTDVTADASGGGVMRMRNCGTCSTRTGRGGQLITCWIVTINEIDGSCSPESSGCVTPCTG